MLHVKTVLRLIFLAVCLLFALPAFAQSTAQEMETLLETNAVTYAQAARLILQAADVNVTANRWFEHAEEQKLLPKNVSADDTARLDGIAFLVMRSFDIKGGILYSLYQTPHYAYRELVYQNIIQGRTDPAMAVSGSVLLFITNRVFAVKEEEN